ncbi:hypothetical protein HHK36_000097 [Tetracentron sinense]|uniref:Enhanced disease resistance 4-like N-terminal domain-containing protein n=1 Tax=Tetracentron sinense TaxID=13715 RepID=A0A835DQI4_TETSI|nr:hypothetical protein HHK36_000097 [Tetracentron sinense]
MAEGVNVRVVRCPKCENLLPELPDYPFYQCGGCGAVLRAKNKTPATDGSSEKSDEEKGKGGSGKLENLLEKEGVNLSDASETGRESNGVESGRRRERILPEIAANSNSSSSSSRTENRDVLTDYNGGKEVETMGAWYDQRNVEREIEYAGKYRRTSKAPIDNWVIENDHDLNMNKDQLTKANMEKEFGESTPQIGIASGSRRSGKIPDWQDAERDGMTACQRNPRAVLEKMGFPTSPYPDECQSNYHPGSSYDNGEPTMNQNNIDGYSRVKYLEQDRAELLRKLDELKDQLNRSCDVADRPKERVPLNKGMVPPDPYGGHDTWSPCLSSNRASMQSFAPDNHVPSAPFSNRSHDPIPLMNKLDMDKLNLYPPPIHAPYQIPGYGDPFGPQMHKRASHPPPHQYPKPYHEYFSGQYMDMDSDPFALYPHKTFFHQPACSCLHCYNKHWQVPAQVPPAVFRNKGFPDAPTNPMFRHLENPATFAPWVYNPNSANPPPLLSHGYANWGGMKSYADDYDDSGYNFQSIDTEPILLSKDQRLNLSESEKMQGFLSSYSGTSEDEESLDSVIDQREVSKSDELHLKVNATPPVPGLPLHENFDSSNHALRFGKGNTSTRSDKEKVILNRGTSRQHSVKDASVTTEMEVSSNAYSNSGFSQDSREVSKEEHQPRISKGGESFFASLTKKSFRDFFRSNQTVENGRSNVWINEQPISGHLVKKAERKAGPIHPGQYWYDFRAGFWGVMGQPCLGIIPPSIEEFNYPMPKNCAAGNTGILVNGRELHKEDLYLLANRGLPTTRDKSYIIEISGRVWDEDSGEELDSLGKLAPSVENARHGFGIQVP